MFSGFVVLVCVLAFSLYLSIIIGLFGKLPGKAELAGIKNEEASLVYSSNGTLIGKIFSLNRINIKREDLPDQLVHALISTEDKRFFSHGGIDKVGYLRVLFKTILEGDRSSGGGSTLSQQLAKNLYGRKKIGFMTLPIAKIREAILAVRIEKIYNKEEVLLLYLNTVPFGENVYGIEAASQRFFSCTSRELKVEQMATLIGMLKANTQYNPRLQPENAVSRRNQVLQLMARQHYLSQETCDSLRNLPLNLQYSNFDIHSPAGYFVHKVNLMAEDILRANEEKTGKHYDLKKDGLRIITTLDIDLQMIALKAASSHLAQMQKIFDAEINNNTTRKTWEKKKSKENNLQWKNNPLSTGDVFNWEDDLPEARTYRDSLWHYYKMLHAAVLITEPNSGKIRTWIGGNNYQFLPYDLVNAKRQIASAFKPIIYAAALENGMSPCAYLDNEEKIYTGYDDWQPQNFDKTSGDKIAMWYALAHSMNLPTIDLYFNTGYERINDMCMKLGLPAVKGDYPSVAIGSMDISLQEIVFAYGAFDNEGVMADPVFIESITDRDGNLIYRHPGNDDKQVLPEDVAMQITAILQKAINEGTGIKLRQQYGIRMELAGKTGTAQDYSDAWFISYSPNLLIGTWVGAMSPDVHFNSATGSGSALALPIAGSIWKNIEGSPSLAGKYTGSFNIPLSILDMMDCEPVKKSTIFDKLFERDTRSDQPQKAKAEKPAREKTNAGKFFDKLFRKKKK